MDNPAFDPRFAEEEPPAYKMSLSLDEIERTNGGGAVVRSQKASSAQEAIASALVYKIEDVPPWYMSLFVGFQHYLTMVGATVACPFFLTPSLCMADDEPDRANIISTLIFISGIITLLQSTWGTRLPIVQGGSFSFLIPALAIMELPQWKCPAPEVLAALSDEQRTEFWQVRMREVQGAIIVASLFEAFFGFCGIIGMILKYITPLTVAPAIFLIGLALFKEAAAESAKNWYISSLTMALLILFSQYLRNVQVPIPFTRKPERDNKMLRFPVFQVFPIVLALIITWGICGILTASGALSPGDLARTDAKLKLFEQAPWFRIPYPFQWGWPTVSIGAVLGMLSGVFASTIESIGDYYSCARISGVDAPPTHAMNRGIFIEGFGCVLSGIWGSGNGSTSYSNNIGTISVTKVASRRVVQASGLIMLVLSLVGKAGAVFVGIPDPIVGGMFCFVFAIVMAVGLSNLQGVDFNSSRNIFIIGFSIFFALAISEYIKQHPIVTGNDTVDQIFQILLTTGMFVAGVLGFVFDNTIPGTIEERGLVDWTAATSPGTSGQGESREARIYDLPYIHNYLEKVNWTKFLPILPQFKGSLLKRRKATADITLP